ncbi:aspartate-semialdehyde dehydrogenase [Mariniblastus fucicola]|uniref:Aspartate-semialdehyde dehydrogenase n=1 Tax=Mariniblastus fucicola TaxID=980251 RepID=A0A5B9PD84_9BACT|nr:aspartate-semialdehyde dehydrogenase [Mariniblastus fucicola]QEG24274.1 Aspartate-semialdehyde dehydrogenase [Mariniblastus fucicola]
MAKRIAIAGATGAVGTLVRQMLEDRNFPYETITFLASKRSAGSTIEFKGETHTIKLLEPDAFNDIDIVIGSTPDDVAAMFVPWAVERGCIVVDESGYHRMLDHVPLVVPEVNADAIADHKGIIASPNCSTTQMVVAMKPIHDAAKIKRVIVSTYQATSGAGVKGQQDLTDGSRAFLEEKEHDYQAFSHPIAFNVIPQIGSHKADGYTSEELKMVYETRKIFGDDSIQVCPTCVRVPVSNCHSETILLETERPVSPEEARKLFEDAEGITVVDDLDGGIYPMPNNSDDLDDVFVGRIRKDISCENGLTFWCVSDNLRKGAATNAVQIAELLVSDKYSACGTSN